MKIKFIALCIAATFTFTSCGDGKKAPEKLGEDAPKRTIVIEANDKMKYNMAEIKVKSGERITLTLNNVGKMLKLSMGHNVVILKQGVDMEEFATKSREYASNDYIPEEGKDIIAYTKMLGGGESDTITFDAPAKGIYDFICSFPGHWALMKGKFIVE